jgi:DNA adenine methylase
MVPVIKYAGGKRKLLPHLRPFYCDLKGKLYEPFVGGGAVLFDTNNEAVINDLNPHLISFYNQLKINPLDLLTDALALEISEVNYYKIRALAPTTDYDRAVRFLYLNKCAFNGVWRENLKGRMNIAWNKKLKVGFPSPDQMIEASLRLQNVSITCQDFAEACADANNGDFVYLDPPYSTGFSEYTAEKFDDKSLARLRDLCDRLNDRGVNWIMSNSNSDIVRRKFSEYTITEIDYKYLLSPGASYRVPIKELIVTNARN